MYCGIPYLCFLYLTFLIFNHVRLNMEVTMFFFTVSFPSSSSEGNAVEFHAFAVLFFFFCPFFYLHHGSFKIQVHDVSLLVHFPPRCCRIPYMCWLFLRHSFYFYHVCFRMQGQFSFSVPIFHYRVRAL